MFLEGFAKIGFVKPRIDLILRVARGVGVWGSCQGRFPPTAAAPPHSLRSFGES